jgi:hypothetical protein
MPLTRVAIHSAKPAEKPRKLFDGDGLYLLVNPNGSKWWRFKYRFNGKEKGLSFGVYPAVSLKQARELREAARVLVAAKKDPSLQRQVANESRAITFELIAREWFATQEKKLASITLRKARWMLERFIFPILGDRAIADIEAADLLQALRKVEARGTHETAHRVKQRVGQIFRYAIATSRAKHDIAADLKGALAPAVTVHHAAVTDPVGIGQLLRAIDCYQGQPMTSLALKLAPLLVRQESCEQRNGGSSTWSAQSGESQPSARRRDKPTSCHSQLKLWSCSKTFASSPATDAWYFLPFVAMTAR